MTNPHYSVSSIVESLKQSLHQYLEAQYHIWDESLIRERQALFNSEIHAVTHQTPALEATPFYGYGKTFDRLDIPLPAKEALLKASTFNVGIYSKPYKHQGEALEHFLGKNDDIIVATGTGSGKTESFLMPLLGSLAIEAKERSNTAGLHGVRALLLYPMNALVNDQLGRLRRLFGNQNIAEILAVGRNRPVTFGMYTSRTPYAGIRDNTKDKRVIGELIKKLFGPEISEARAILEKEGKWPSKDLEAFARNNFRTGPSDRELFTRHEMHERAPDILVTNYSMLEYMMLRPIERSIFDQTQEWLESDKENQFLVVLDEAHMYRGAAGAEVAFLLRRLQSRLKIDRSRIKYILTSASLGNSLDAEQKVKSFASALTGLDETHKTFHLIKGFVEKANGAKAASAHQVAALKNFSADKLHNAEINLTEAENEFSILCKATEAPPPSKCQSVADLKDKIYSYLERLPPAAALANQITGAPHTFAQILETVFDKQSGSPEALENMLALCSFAQRKDDGRVFLPVRLHTFYRGIGGLYACINPNCSHRLDKSPGPFLLGRMFDNPRQTCHCGSRVFELLTHRDCGGTFIRAFLRTAEGDFAWHEAGTSHTDGRALVEVHFLVESTRNIGLESTTVWLHKETGRIERRTPTANISDFIVLMQSRGRVSSDARNPIHTFARRCPICDGRLPEGTQKIMDLATKGEAPFAHLTTAQLKIQPTFIKPDKRLPNQGRKNLLFSDGRQKAARLARDIPREIGQDIFRQVLLYAVDQLKQLSEEARLDKIYGAVLYALKTFNLTLFDGKDYDSIRSDLVSLEIGRYTDIKDCYNEFTSPPPERFNEQLLRQLGSSYYSIHALALAYTSPTKRVMRILESELSWLNKEQVNELAISWIQFFLKEMAFNPRINIGTRCKAMGFPKPLWGLPAGFKKKKLPILERIYTRADEIEAVFIRELAIEHGNAFYIDPQRVQINLAAHENWHQCQRCTHLSYVTWQGSCVNCGHASTKPLNPATSDYLRARKTFWRDPILRIIDGSTIPININAREHTAQLSHRDQEEIKSTTEEYERLFKDILVHSQDYPIDMLSSTTTMEVGIDIGSLIAVALRNVPPQRQNYQQRVGRTGRRGAAISTVLTYAQNSPHDYFYFKNINKIIAGDPPSPKVDTSNSRLIRRHIHAALLQEFFHNQVTHTTPRRSGIFDTLGDTWDFYHGEGEFTFAMFQQWLREHAEDDGVLADIQAWIPKDANLSAQIAAHDLLNKLADNRPQSEEELEGNGKNLIDFLFLRGLLPSYAFPKDLCALQIEEEKYAGDNYRKVSIVEKPQQSLNVALSEYAPGRIVVVDKLTYRVAAVAANRSNSTENRAAALFENMKSYRHCHECSFTQSHSPDNNTTISNCPVCDSTRFEVLNVIQPEVVFPENHGPVDELDDDPVFSSTTSAQLPVPRMEEELNWKDAGTHSRFAYAVNQPLVMLNKGKYEDEQYTGFMVCNKCGHSTFPEDERHALHDRHYYIQQVRGHEKPSRRCNGEYRHVSLGYTFTTDILLLEVNLTSPLDTDINSLVSRKALDDALRSLCEALCLAACNILDIDSRELNAGHRLMNRRGVISADVFLYDAVSGGAGYAAMAGEQFADIISKAKEFLNDCTCQKSCDKCLRHYGNKHNHSSLDRNLALALLEYAIEGKLPAIKDIASQASELMPLRKILEMAGWAHETGQNIPLQVRRDNRVLKFATCPSLLDPAAAGHMLNDTCEVISTYKLQNNLAGVFADIGS